MPSSLWMIGVVKRNGCYFWQGFQEDRNKMRNFMHSSCITMPILMDIVEVIYIEHNQIFNLLNKHKY